MESHCSALYLTRVTAEFAAYQPCSHSGPCEGAHCHCHAHHLHCEKYCACAPDCKRRAKGCKCTYQGTLQISPRLTGTRLGPVHAALLVRAELPRVRRGPVPVRPKLLRPTRSANDETQGMRGYICRPLHTPLTLLQHVWIGASAVAGFGVFAVDRIKKGEFIGEYVGEVRPVLFLDRSNFYLRSFLTTKPRDAA